MLEVRYGDDEKVDEIVATGMVHLERMNDTDWCLIVYTGQARGHFSISRRGKFVETSIVEIAPDSTPTTSEKQP